MGKGDSNRGLLYIGDGRVSRGLAKIFLTLVCAMQVFCALLSLKLYVYVLLLPCICDPCHNIKKMDTTSAFPLSSDCPKVSASNNGPSEHFHEDGHRS